MDDCKATISGQQYTCDQCNMSWDFGDTDIICGATLLTKEEIKSKLTWLRDRMGEPLVKS